MKKKFVSLEKKFIYILGFFNAFVCILIPIGLTFFSYKYEDARIDKLITKIPQTINKDVLPYMEPFKPKYFERFFKAAINVRELKYINISDPQGKILIEQRKGNLKDKHTENLQYKLTSPKSGKHLGFVDIIITKDQLYIEIENEFIKTFIAMVIWSVFISFIVWFTLKRILINPLNAIRNYLISLEKGQTTLPEPLVLKRFKILFRRDQLDDVAEALEEAAKKAIQGNIDGRDRYKIIEGEVINRTELLLNEKQKADAANEEKTEFISHISHEIRNPINAISGFVNILEKEVNDPAEKELIVPLKAATGNLLRLVNDLLDISKAELGKLTVEKKVVDTRQTISNMEKMFRIRVEEKGLELIVEVDPDFPEFVKTDGIRTAQIMQNLLSNAIKFTDQGQIKIELKSIKLPIQNEVNIKILVRDTGIGVPENEREKIFEKYRQMTGQSYQKYQGSGLGLAISKKIAKLLNGDLKVIDNEGPGSCFEFTINEVEVVSEQKVTEPVEEKEDFKFFDSKVLVVDDEKLNRDLVMWNLRPYNLKLFFAENGKEALNKALINKPDIILMDLLMPQMDGIESIELIKVYENLKDIPIIVISAIINSENEEKIKSLANGMMRKPVHQNDLVKEIAKFLPHEIVMVDEVSTPEKVIELPADAPIPPELRKILIEKYLPQIEELKEIMAIDEIKTFANDIKKLGTEYSCKSMGTWSDNMLGQIRNFNVGEIVKSLDNFKGLVEEKTLDKKAS